MLFSACASQSAIERTDDTAVSEAEPSTATTESRGEPETPPGESAEVPSEAPNNALVDRTQRTVFNVVNNTARWIDGFFGGSELEERPDVSYGRLNVGALWDERDDLRERIRLRARVPMPALERRTQLILGRGDTDDFVDGTDSDLIDRLPDTFSDFEDDDWFLGLGFTGSKGLSSGFDLGVGASVSSSSLQPYLRATYRWHRSFGDRTLLRVRPRAFWQEERGTGASLTTILDYVLNSRWMLRSWNIVKAEEEIDGLGWTSELVAYQSLSNNAAFAYSLYATGETRNEVELQDYGVELRFRRRIHREWLFIELSTSVGWPREFLTEERESNLGFGLEFELQFGDWPDRKQTK